MVKLGGVVTVVAESIISSDRNVVNWLKFTDQSTGVAQQAHQRLWLAVLAEALYIAALASTCRNQLKTRFVIDHIP